MATPSIVLIQHVHLATTSRPSPGASALTAAALYVAVTSAGLLAAPVLTGVGGSRRVRLPILAAGLGGYAALLAAMGSTGQISAVRMAAALALACVAGAALPLSPATQLVGAAALLAGELVISGAGITYTVVVALHLVAAAIWAGGVLHLALIGSTRAGRPLLGGAIRRLSPWAVGSAVALVASGYLLLRIDRVGVGSLGSSGFGRLVLAKITVLVVAAGLGFVHRRLRGRIALDRRPLVVRAEATTLAAAVGLAGVLIGTAAPAPVLQLAGPGLAVVRIPDAPAEALLVTALGPDVGAVRVLSSEGVRLVDRFTHQAHQVGPGGAARVELRDGIARLALTSGLSTVEVSVPAESPQRPSADGAATADPVSWLDYQLGRVLGIAAGGSTRSAPSAGCVTPSPWHEGAAMGSALHQQRTTEIALISDSSSRAVALAGGLERAGVHLTSLRSSHAVLVATDAMRARSVLSRLADRPSVRAVYLAPWLLDGRVLSLLATTRLPPLLVASTVDAMSPLADRYRAALAGIADGVAPSVAGLVGYADAVAPDSVGGDQLTLYSASPVGFLPGVLDVGHDHGSNDGWFVGGSLVPTSAAALRTAPSCPVT